MKGRVLVAVGAEESIGPVSKVSFLVRLGVKGGGGARFVLNICADPGVTHCRQLPLRGWY